MAIRGSANFDSFYHNLEMNVSANNFLMIASANFVSKNR